MTDRLPERPEPEWIEVEPFAELQAAIDRGNAAIRDAVKHPAYTSLRNAMKKRN